MRDANSWREPLRSLDSTEAQGLTAACLVSTRILQAFGNFILSSSVRHSVEASSTSREPHLIPPHHCSRSYNGDGVGRSTERRRSVGSTRSNPALVLHSLRCKNAEALDPLGKPAGLAHHSGCRQSSRRKLELPASVCDLSRDRFADSTVRRRDLRTA